MSKDTLSMMLAAQAILDAKPVQQHGRMAWDGVTMHGPIVDDAPGAFSRFSYVISPQVKDPFAWPAPAGVEAALLESIVYGCGMWQQGPIKATHIDPASIWKPNTPAEVDAFVDSLIRDDIDTRFRGTWRLTRLSTALRAAYP